MSEFPSFKKKINMRSISKSANPKGILLKTSDKDCSRDQIIELAKIKESVRNLKGDITNSVEI